MKKARQKFIFGKALEKRPIADGYPSAGEIERFIAANGVTKCPTAAADVTTAIITPADAAAIAAHQKAREDAFWESGIGSGLRLAAANGAATRKARRR